MQAIIASARIVYYTNMVATNIKFEGLVLHSGVYSGCLA